MAQPQFRFDDGASYERMMGVWSRLAGEVFLDWLAPKTTLRWIDVGCGNGAFSDLIVSRCAPAALLGIDPSEGQLAFARERLSGQSVEFRQGDAMALPSGDASFDIAVMALVIFFVPDPAKSVAEMRRVVCPGGTVATYAWDILGGGFPLEPIQAELRAMGTAPLLPPSVEAARIDNLRALWTGAGLADIATTEITVHRTFADFDEFWSIAMLSNARALIEKLPAGDADVLKSRVAAQLGKTGPVTCTARANAITGRVPA